MLCLAFFYITEHSKYIGCKTVSTRGGAKGGFPGPCPPNELLCPPLSILSLLNVIDFEGESKTDKIVHIRKQVHALASVSNYTRWRAVVEPLC